MAEIGDKTQLLCFVLAARLRKPWPILAGILVATVANHTAAAWAGSVLAGLIPETLLTWMVGLSFLAFGLWALRPDVLDGSPAVLKAGAFVTALVVFFLAEMGDKTQLATVALAARFDALTQVIVVQRWNDARNVPRVDRDVGATDPMRTVVCRRQRCSSWAACSRWGTSFIGMARERPMGTGTADAVVMPLRIAVTPVLVSTGFRR